MIFKFKKHLNIIVLLIPAGISISMLYGDNGIIQNTPSAESNNYVLYVLESTGGYVNMGSYNGGDALILTVISVPISKIGNGIMITEGYFTKSKIQLTK